jgi:hypothetical protein
MDVDTVSLKLKIHRVNLLRREGRETVWPDTKRYVALGTTRSYGREGWAVVQRVAIGPGMAETRCQVPGLSCQHACAIFRAGGDEREACACS